MNVTIFKEDQDAILSHFCGLYRGDIPDRYLESASLVEFVEGLNDWCPGCSMERADLPREPFDADDKEWNEEEWAGWVDITVEEVVEFLSKHKVGINPEAW